MKSPIKNTKHVSGFTIVELIIVIIVIGILAGIALASYNGAQKRATIASVESDLTNARDQLAITNATAHTYPSDAPSANLSPSTGTTFTYTYSASDNTYCLTAVNNGVTMSILPKSNPSNGDCSQTGLVAQWKLNGDATDASGNGHDGTVSGAALTTGQTSSTNTAYSFNGSSSYISIPSFNVSNNITVSAWVYPTTSNQNSAIIAKQTGTSDAQGTLGLYNGTGSFELTTSVNNGTWNRIVTTSALPTNTWSLLTGTYDGRTISLYLNGALSSTIGSTQSIVTSNLPWTIGSLSNHTSNFLAGSVDDVRIYSRCLSATEAQQLYTNRAQ